MSVNKLKKVKKAAAKPVKKYTKGEPMGLFAAIKEARRRRLPVLPKRSK